MLNQVRIFRANVVQTRLIWGGGGGKVKFFFKSVKDFKLSLICFIIKENLLIFPFF